MTEAQRSLSTVLVLGVVIAAIAGYLVGVEAHGGAGRPRAPAASVQLHPAFAAGVLLEAPAAWQSARSPAAIAGLAVVRPTTFSPHGEASAEGLLTGQLAGGEPSPLPAAFLAQLARPPATQVVRLEQTEAFRYAGLHVAGFDRPLSVYVIPNPGGASTVLACYGASAAAAPPRTCEAIVATVRFVGQVTNVNLQPDRRYAQSVGAIVEALERARTTLRGELRQASDHESVQRLATSLGGAFATAASALAQIEPALVAGPAQAALTRALTRARAAYAALAVAAGGTSLAAYEAARERVEAGEASVTSALASYALFGYAHA
jgi:hypothetical protein